MMKVRLAAAIACVVLGAWLAPVGRGAEEPAATGPTAVPRVIVATDAGGTDYDDFQSLVHYLVYADRFDTEGLLSTPMGSTGRKEAIEKVVDLYAQDYPKLKTWSARYPEPGTLKAMIRQGRTEFAPLGGVGEATEASKWIIECAKRPDPRPLWILVWGGLEDVAQALNDDPSIEPKLRVYFIGGPNKKWSPRAYDYIALQHPKLWMIEANSTYFGWFVGGNQQGDLGNTTFVPEHVAGKGALGNYFATGISFQSRARASLKMGDTPAVVYMLGAHPEDPTQPSWGGSFVRAWERPRKVFEGPPTQADVVETYAIVHIGYRLPKRSPKDATASLVIGDQEFPGYMDADGRWDFVYCPKEPKAWEYVIKSSDPQLDGQKGGFTSVLPAAGQAASARYPNWYTDNPDPALAEGNQQGAKTVNRFREAYLKDFAGRMMRCETESPRR
jgi:hypothetical protein